jgi:hypothetical protein
VRLLIACHHCLSITLEGERGPMRIIAT